MKRLYEKFLASSGVVTDSRKIVGGELFFALRGENFDGNLYAEKALEGKNTGAGCHFLLQGLVLTQGSNPYCLHLLHWQVDSLPLSHLGS